MTFDDIVSAFRKFVSDFTHSEWIGVAITIVVVVIVTAVVTRILVGLLRNLLEKGKGPLPASSIFINILRVTMWTIAVCVILSTCFNVNIAGLITALGVGGLAVSLGFQSTLSNLIAGLQVSLSGLVKPGDRIRVNSITGATGTVRDVTWSHTSIINDDGEHVVIPNSVITSTALTHLPHKKKTEKKLGQKPEQKPEQKPGQKPEQKPKQGLEQKLEQKLEKKSTEEAPAS